METHIFYIHVLDEKNIQNGISLGDTWFNSKSSVVMSYSNVKSIDDNAHECIK